MREAKGKFDFDHHFALLTNLASLLFYFILFWLVERIIFFKLFKTDLPFRFCKIGLGKTLFIFGRKNGRLFCLFCNVCCNTLFDFALLFFKLKHSSS